jgi:hypothetical protein
MTVRQIAVDYPACREVLVRYGEPAGRVPFGHLETLDQFARRQAASLRDLLAELAGAAGVGVDEITPAARHAHGPFVVAALAVTLSLGAGWGTLLLFAIAGAGSFAAVSAADVVAHGEAQLWGFVALFIMGVAWRWLPMATAQRPPLPWIGHTVLTALLVGVVGGFLWSMLPGALPWLGALSGAALLAGSVAFLAFIVRFVARQLHALWAWFVLAAAMWTLVWAITVVVLRVVYLRDGPAVFSQSNRLLLIELPVYGLALNAVYGFGQRLMPGMLRSRLHPRFIEAGFRVHNLGLFWLVTHRLGVLAAVTWLGQALIVVAAILYAAGLGGLVQRRVLSDRPEQGPRLLARYVQLAFFWLLAGTGLLLAGDLYEALGGGPVPHAWSGAARHALTVGFLTTLILGVGQRLLPILSHMLLHWPGLAGPTLLLIGLGNFWRVGTELTASAWPSALRWMPLSALLELAALGLFTANAVRTLWPPRDPLRRTGRITVTTPVAALLARHPALEDELITAGIGYLARVRAVPAELTIGSMLTNEGVDPGAILARLNALLLGEAESRHREAC